MAQIRIWNYKELDSTKLLNQVNIPTNPRGRYRGFDVSAGGSNVSTIQLAHTTTSFAYESNANCGCVISKDGVVIIETATVPVNLQSAPIGVRWDYILMLHSYSVVVGGTTAVYLSRAGVGTTLPSFSPTETPIGIVKWVNATTYTYEPLPVPDFANDATIVHTDRNQFIRSLKGIRGLEYQTGNSVVSTGNASLILGSSTTIGTSIIDENPDANFFRVSPTTFEGGTLTAGAVINKIVFNTPQAFADPTKVRPFARELKVIFPVDVTLTNTLGAGINLTFPSNINGAMVVRAGNLVTFTQVVDSLNGTDSTMWAVTSGGELRNIGAYKVGALLSTQVVLTSIVSGDRVEWQLSNATNHLFLNNASTSTTNTIRFIRSRNIGLDTIEQGTVLTITAPDNARVVYETALFTSPTPPTGFKPILNPLGYHIGIGFRGSITVRETANYWVVIGTTGEYPVYINVDNSIDPLGTVQVAKFRGVIYLRGAIDIPANNTEPRLFSLPNIRDIDNNLIFFGDDTLRINVNSNLPIIGCDSNINIGFYAQMPILQPSVEVGFSGVSWAL